MKINEQETNNTHLFYWLQDTTGSVEKEEATWKLQGLEPT